MAKNKKQVTVSDWIQYLQYTTKSLETYGAVCLTIFFSLMFIVLALWMVDTNTIQFIDTVQQKEKFLTTSNNNFLIISIIAILFVLLFFIFFIFSFKPSLLLKKIMKNDEISVEEIKTEWYNNKSSIHLLKNKLLKKKQSVK